jgi:hypothetical protein
LLDQLSARAELGLRDMRPLDRPRGTPDNIELATALKHGAQRIGLVASDRDGLELLGWARWVSRRAGGLPLEEVLVAAPLIGTETRRVAEAAQEGPAIRLVSVPALADDAALLFDAGVAGGSDGLEWLPTSPSLMQRVVRILDGAAIATGVAGVRASSRGFVLYIRGVRVLDARPEGDGVGVESLRPHKRHIHVAENNIATRALDLHEWVLELARDPRLVDGEVARRDQAAENLAASVGVRITSRWLPWTADGEDPLDWVGIDANGRAVIGLLQQAVSPVSVPMILAAHYRLEAEREIWAPGSNGSLRVVVAANDVDGDALEMLELLGIDIEARPMTGDAAVADEGADRQARRRPRHRRGGRDDEEREESASAPEAARASDGGERGDRDDSRTDESSRRAPPGRSRGRGRRGGRRDSRDRSDSREDSDAQADARSRDTREPRQDREARDAGRSRERDDAATEIGAAEERPALADASATREEESSQVLEAAEQGSPAESGGDAAESPDPAGDSAGPMAAEAAASAGDAVEEGAELDPVTLEIEATLAEEPESAEDVDEEEAEREPVRRRRQRAAIAVCNDPDSILAALVLARERRHITFFWVCSQDELMDFFRGKATDVDENTDLLLVGFSARPLPRETIASAELYRGRLQWFDHHDWAIEDVEALRGAIGRDSILIAENAARSLLPVVEIAERRSRFTDKLIELSARRLSENDMSKWGYRLIGLTQRMAATSGDYRKEVSPVLSGKPAELPEQPDVYAAESDWLAANAPRLVHFGEYKLAVVRAPNELDAAELGRRARVSTGARLSLSATDGDTLVTLGCNDEKRYINAQGLVDGLVTRHEWAHSRSGGDRVGRFRIDDLLAHPDRIETVIGDIVRHKSVLYG